MAKPDGTLHPIQQAFIDEFAFQCGFCTPGMILAAKALLDENPRPEEADIIHHMDGNICRCTGYVSIVRAIQRAATEVEKEERG
jgi:carbon-monoxide dehydrogenase small subunit